MPCLVPIVITTDPSEITSVILAADSKSHLIAYNSKSIRPRSKIIIPVERRKLLYFIFKFSQNELAVTHQI